MAAVRLVFAPFWPSSPAKVSRHKVRATASRAYSLATYRTKTVGKEGTLHFRRFFEDDSGTRISPWHDIPLYADNTTSASSQPIYHAVIEIPRTYSNFKFRTKRNQFDGQVQTQFYVLRAVVSLSIVSIRVEVLMPTFTNWIHLFARSFFFVPLFPMTIQIPLTVLSFHPFLYRWFFTF